MTADSTPVPAGQTPETASPASDVAAMAKPADDAQVAKPANDGPQVRQPAKGRGVRFWLNLGASGVAMAVVAAFVGAYFLPREPEVTRSIDIAAPRAAVFLLVADLRHLPEWAPWLAVDPTAVVTFTGPLDGVGQTVTWESDRAEVGSGNEKITAITPDSSVEMIVTRSGQQSTAAWFRLAQKGSGETTVVWGFRKDLGFNPVNRYRGLWLDGVVGPDYQRGLKRLKAFAEATPRTD